MTRIFIQILCIVAFPLMIIGYNPALVAADTSTAGAAADVCTGIGAANGTGTGCANDGTSSVDGVLKTVIDILSIIVGIAAVIMLIVAGLRFVVSGGESSNVASAKNSVIYVIVGIVLVALAQIIVHFVLTRPALK